ncbi:MAG: Flp pilus assembly protein CpaB [bacterium]
MERRPRPLLLLALILGLLTAFFIYLYMEQLREEYTGEEVLVPVVVAARDITAPVQITAEMVTLVEIDPRWRHQGAATALEDVLDLWATRDFAAGEQVLQPLLVAGGEQDALVYRIPAGMRAVTIPITAVTGVDGRLRPGDRIDVLVTFDKELLNSDWDRTITLLQDIEVLSLGGAGDQGQGATATLAVTPKQAEELTLADERGSLRLSLRPAAAADRMPTSGVIPPALLEERR